MVRISRKIAVFSAIFAAILCQAAFAQGDSTTLTETATVCDGQSAAILSSFASDEARIAEMLGLESECGGTGVYEARLAQLYAETRDFDKGIVVAEAALALQSDYEREAYVALTHLALGRSDMAKAMEYAHFLAMNHRDWARSFVTAGLVMQRSRQYPAAIVNLHTANEIEETGEAYLILSGLYYSTGRYENALQAHERALQLDPSSRRFTEYLVVAVTSLLELGRPDDARAVLDRHLALIPHHESSPMVTFLESELAKQVRGREDPFAIVPSAGAGREEAAPQVDRSAQRSSSEIRAVLEQNKGAFYALYNRALRRVPGIRGEVVFRLRIQPNGRVDECTVAESEIDDEQFLERLCQRLLLVRFEALNVPNATTVNYPIDFIPN
ncbi:MAG: AgmX/PglI C-terminal domain-containing protein [Woeseiaceae bacterium]|nr:AgmX/PglI C-terminal domain-containing protein [Woeseiaceae bacterium]